MRRIDPRRLTDAELRTRALDIAEEIERIASQGAPLTEVERRWLNLAVIALEGGQMDEQA